MREIPEQAQTGTVAVQVVSQDRQDIREALFFRMAEKGYPILEMQKTSMSLEDIFVKLTTNEKEDDTAAETEDQLEAEDEMDGDEHA
ncbi:MAG: hypothetical protein A2189_05315 [Paenibacillus sp. RIFOXYA1_FULL_44_5]|nr:MAG: hypothetical protein A2189_05315 [Paenibacillus sp. RIFOXYA1_FULL_44_5]